MEAKLLANGYTQVDPTVKQTACYWVACGGTCMAVVVPNPGQSCIASVESDMGAMFGCRGGGYDDVYVIWQPENCTLATWTRWLKKWSVRTRQNPYAVRQAA